MQSVVKAQQNNISEQEVEEIILFLFPLTKQTEQSNRIFIAIFGDTEQIPR